MQGFDKLSVHAELPKSTSCPDSISIFSDLDSTNKSTKTSTPLTTGTTSTSTTQATYTPPKTTSGSTLKPQSIYATYSPSSSRTHTPIDEHHGRASSPFSSKNQKSQSLNSTLSSPSASKALEATNRTLEYALSLFSINDKSKSVSPSSSAIITNNNMTYSSNASTSSYSSSASTVPSSTGSSPSSSPPPSFRRTSSTSPSHRSSSSNRLSNELYSSHSDWDLNEEGEEGEDDHSDDGIIRRKVSHKYQMSDETGYDEGIKNQRWKRFSNLIGKEKRFPQSVHFQDQNLSRTRVNSDTTSLSSLSSSSIPTVSVTASTTTSVSVAMNFPTRPLALPPKNQIEQKKHRKMHEEMMKNARIREEKENKKHEEREKIMAVRTMLWENHILPHWEEKKTNRRTMVLWEQGLPPKVRGRVWKSAIGNGLNITEELFQICIDRANAAKKSAQSQKLGREESVELIKTDLHRTFPTIRVFQPGGPFHNSLEKVLQAYACYRPDIGYVQGMSFIASILLLNMEELDAFICLCNLLNRSSLMVFYQLESIKIQSYVNMFTNLGKDILPEIFNHLQRVNLDVQVFLLDWILTLYSKSLSLENASRVWDCYLLYGDYYLFKTALGILKYLEKRIIGQPFDSIAFDLTHLPQMDEDLLFESINSIPLGEKRFQIASNRYLLK